MGQAIGRFFKKYARFKGFASRSEFWWVTLAQFLLFLLLGGGYIGVFAALAEGSANLETFTTATSASFEAEGGAAVALLTMSLLNLAVALALLIPTLAVTWRRLHDAGLPGPLYFLIFIPAVGSITLLILLALPTRSEKHKQIWADPLND